MAGRQTKVAKRSDEVEDSCGFVTKRCGDGKGEGVEEELMWCTYQWFSGRADDIDKQWWAR